MERDIERLGSDKDAYDEQRDDVEEEIDRLEEQVRDVEEETRQHALLSSTQNGRINVAHARKKRRLDAELERLLETIEQKRASIADLEDQAADKARVRDEREAEMVHLEKELVQILVEQQKVRAWRGRTHNMCVSPLPHAVPPPTLLPLLPHCVAGGTDLRGARAGVRRPCAGHRPGHGRAVAAARHRGAGLRRDALRRGGRVARENRPARVLKIRRDWRGPRSLKTMYHETIKTW